MEPITVKVCIEPSASLPGVFLGFSSYELIGQGHKGDRESAKRSVESVIVNHLDAFAHRGRELPQPNLNFSVEGYVLEERVEHHYEGLPPLIFEFYRQPQN